MEISKIQLKCYTKNEPITISKLAEDLGEKKGSINVTINRKEEFFNTSSVRGKEGLLEVSNFAIDEINSRIDNYHRIIRQKEEKEEEEKVVEAEFEEVDKDE